MPKLMRRQKGLKANMEGLKVEMEGLKAEMSVTKKTNIVEFKELDTYKFELNSTTALFLAKERVKTKRLLRRLYEIEDMVFLDALDPEPTFFNAKDDKEEEEGKEVTQDEPTRGLFLA